MDESLAVLRAAADALEVDFDVVCGQHYPSRWDFYRDDYAGLLTPPEVQLAHDDWMQALHAFYLARDGAKGFLGGRGQ